MCSILCNGIASRDRLPAEQPVCGRRDNGRQAEDFRKLIQGVGGEPQRSWGTVTLMMLFSSPSYFHSTLHLGMRPCPRDGSEPRTATVGRAGVEQDL